MKSYKKILKKNNKHNLGRIIKNLLLDQQNSKKIIKHVSHCLTRKRSHAGTRFDKLGFFEIKKETRKKSEKEKAKKEVTKLIKEYEDIKDKDRYIYFNLNLKLSIKINKS